MSLIDADEFAKLHDVVFRDDYPGYRPNVVESPDGDGRWNSEKRYAHVAMKYVKGYSGWDGDYLIKTLEDLTDQARAVSVDLGVPRAYWPTPEYSALRILEYPPGATSNPHKDFDLFTLMCYRNVPAAFRYVGGMDAELSQAQRLNEQIHFGEILEVVCPHYKATEHEVIADHVTQYSAVFFAIPDHGAPMPWPHVSVGSWLEERLSRSRKEVTE